MWGAYRWQHKSDPRRTVRLVANAAHHLGPGVFAAREMGLTSPTKLGKVTIMRQPLLILGLIVVAGLGAYRALRYGEGSRRWLGLLPVLFLLNCLASPFIIGFIKGAGNAGTSLDELLLVIVVGSLLLAAVSGAILSLVFRPHR